MIFMFALTPVQLIAIMVLLWYQIKAYSFISLGILLIMMPFGGIVASKMYSIPLQSPKLISHIIISSSIIHMKVHDLWPSSTSNRRASEARHGARPGYPHRQGVSLLLSSSVIYDFLWF